MTETEIRPGVLRRPRDNEIEAIAGWHPTSVEEVAGWWAAPDVIPWVMVDADDSLLGYEEVWLDVEEDEVELARLIVPPELRCRGLGRRLVRALMDQAAATRLSTTFLRVQPGNEIALRCYRACGFEQLSPEESALWNEGQRQEWVWMLLAA
jgi:ribosomal protein S18 acetylase RimI-like enzyme